MKGDYHIGLNAKTGIVLHRKTQSKAFAGDRLPASFDGETIVPTFSYQFYALSKDANFPDRRSRSEDLKDVAKWYLQSLNELGDGKRFDCSISWVGADGANAEIRNSSFASASLKACLGHSEELDILRNLSQLFQELD